eukprot:TRINITY_DN60352_c0_g1_i1.p1 TRINITY_DN60352_c0_g1~~TRINITY_DN60352_c0_g1_i1.p1  ORF type:complete len:224 (+),score=66.83 TRINITY_DN60352_c0_g1_i1:79-750(+)
MAATLWEAELLINPTVLLWAVCVVVYTALRVLGRVVFGNGQLKGRYSVVSYYVAVFHQGVVLPALGLALLCGVGPGSLPDELIYATTAAYFISDFGDCCVADRILVVHHILSVTIALAGQTLAPAPYRYGAYNVLFLEAGALWIHLHDLYPSALNRWLRFATYVLSRLAMAVTTRLLLAELPRWEQIAFLIPTLALCAHNFFVATKMWKAARRDDGPGAKAVV